MYKTSTHYAGLKNVELKWEKQVCGWMPLYMGHAIDEGTRAIYAEITEQK